MAQNIDPALLRVYAQIAVAFKAFNSFCNSPFLSTLAGAWNSCANGGHNIQTYLNDLTCIIQQENGYMNTWNLQCNQMDRQVVQRLDFQTRQKLIEISQIMQNILKQHHEDLVELNRWKNQSKL